MDKSLQLTLTAPAGMTDEEIVEHMVAHSHRLQLAVVVPRGCCDFLVFPHWSLEQAVEQNESFLRGWHKQFSRKPR